MIERAYGRVRVIHGDCLDVMAQLAGAGVRVDAIATDPPYELNFMGRAWDRAGVAFQVKTWRRCFDLLPPGGHLLAFGAAKTHHRMWVAIEDAGFEIRDMVAWLYGSGFPKSMDVADAFDKQLLGFGPDDDPVDWAHSRSHFAAYWEGHGTALKPAIEPLCLARRPLEGTTIAENLHRHGVGTFNVDACRVAADSRPLRVSDRRLQHNTYAPGLGGSRAAGETDLGRWPANVVHDGSPAIISSLPDAPGQAATVTGAEPSTTRRRVFTTGLKGERKASIPRGDSGSAARFFYSAKADADDRAGSKHPTIKPIDLMRWLLRLITPGGGYGA